MKLIWMSDLHFLADAQIVGHDAEVRVNAAVGHINAHHRDSDLCIISGDLTNDGEANDYAALKSHLDELTCPYFVMVGNHDDRQLVRDAFPAPSGAMDDFVQYAIDADDMRLLCLDTMNSENGDGQFCDARMDWLREELVKSEGRPTYVFMHHPPMPVGLPTLDTSKIAEGDALLDLLATCPDVCYLFMGHVHRPICGTVRGMPFATMRSVLFQAPAAEPAWNWERFAPCKEAPNIGLLMIDGPNVLMHYDQFCRYETGAPA